MDRLEEMFAHQLRLQVKLGTFKQIDDIITRQQFINEMLLACHCELVEVQAETMWKDHAVPFGWKHQDFNEQKYKEEIIDLWHFTMNLWLAVGGTPSEFFELYCEKNKINQQRKDEGY